jgi:hypothetical protein
VSTFRVERAFPGPKLGGQLPESRRRLKVIEARGGGHGGCRFPNRVSYGDRLTCCDARCLTRCHLASVSDSCHFFRTSQTCTCDGNTSCSCRRAQACSSGTVFVTVTVRAARCRKPTSITGEHGRSQRRCARTPHPRCTASDKPYTAPVPTAPLESDHRDSNCGSPRPGCPAQAATGLNAPTVVASAINIPADFGHHAWVIDIQPHVSVPHR